MSETPRSAAPRRKSSLAIISNIFSSKSIDNDSSEDENNEDHIDKLIAEGARGIISFKVYCVLTDTAKSLHIVLYNGQIYQINHKNQRKIISCKDINSITIRPDHNVITEIKKSRNMSTREKRYIFQTDENALQYKRYVDTIKSNGHLISRAFDIFDRKGDGILNSLSVEFALKCFDINATQEDVRNMYVINLACSSPS